MVASAIRGKRGQRLLRDLAVALDAMPNKRLVAKEFVTPTGEVCALGCVGRARGLVMDDLDPTAHEQVGAALDVSRVLVAEIEHVNDEWNWNATPEERWRLMRQWVAEQIIVENKP
jgi:hypothetical protein